MQGLSRDLKGYHCKLIFRRFPRTLLQFDLAVLLYLALQWVVGVRPGLKQILLSLIGWKSLGNSNWYMFAIFCLYLLTFVAFLPFVNGNGRWGLYAGCYVLTVLTIIYIFIQIKMERPEYTYNTVILFPAGCTFSLFHERLERMLKKWPSAFLYIVTILVIAYYAAFEYRNQYGIAGYTVWAFLFTAILILFTMKVSIGNPFLDWIGDHIFGMFILQRIPMILLQKAGMTRHSYYLCGSMLYMYTAAGRMV